MRGYNPSRSCTETESYGLRRGSYAKPVPLLVERRGSHTTDSMDNPLETIVCEGWQPMNQPENPSFKLYIAMQTNIQLYAQAITDGDKETVRNMGELFDSTFKKVRLGMGKKYEQSLFRVLEEKYSGLSKAMKKSSHSRVGAVMERI